MATTVTTIIYLLSNLELSAIILSFVMLSAIILSVIMLSVIIFVMVPFVQWKMQYESKALVNTTIFLNMF
jgi:hypothetical protein